MLILLLPISIVILFGIRKYAQGKKNNYQPDMKSKTVLVTGGTDGIGKENVKEFCKLNATVIFTGKSHEKGENFINQLHNEYKNCNVEFIQSDFSDLKNVKKLAELIIKKYKTIDILVNNAGCILNKREIINNEIDKTILINHISPYYLTSLLMPIIVNDNNEKRIINVSGKMHNLAEYDDNDFYNLNEPRLNELKIYAKSKLYNLLFTKGLKLFIENKKYENIKTVSLHPGGVSSNFYSNLPKKLKIIRYLTYPLFKLIFKSPEMGAQCTNYLALCPFNELINGEYYQELLPRKHKEICKNEEIIKKFWNQNIDIVTILTNEKLYFERIN